MAPLQTIESRAPVKALSLFVVLVVAKICTLTGRDISAFAWPSLFWDDALVAVIFAVFERLTRRHPFPSTVLYFVVVAYAAINVPIARLTSSALTLQMMRATGSALSDSIAHHLTTTNIFFIALIIATAIALPVIARRVSSRSCRIFALAALGAGILGFFLGAPMGGFERNAFSTFVRSSLPRVQARTASIDWRSPVVEAGYHDETLQFLRGAARGRNVVVIVLESTAAQYLKAYGARLDPTPNLSALAERAVLFENAYCVYPESIKGLFSTLCSRYPAFDTDAADYARCDTPAIAHVLRDARYRTALFHSGRFMYLDMHSIIDNRGFDTLEDAGDIGGNHNSSFGVDEPSTVRRILQWMDSLKPDEPFLVMYLPIAGHHPYEVPGDGPFQGSDEQTRYLNALHYGDASLGELLKAMKARGTDTNTVFIVYGDHGEAFGQHAGNFGHTFFLYEENVHVPLLIATPGLIEKPMRIKNIASLLDVAPTLVDLIGLNAPADWQGTSLLNEQPRTALFFTDYSLPLVGLRDGHNKIICELGTDRAQMFDLIASPGEARNAVSDDSALLTIYRCHLESWAAAQKALFKPAGRLTMRQMHQLAGARETQSKPPPPTGPHSRIASRIGLRKSAYHINQIATARVSLSSASQAAHTIPAWRCHDAGRR